MIWVIWIFPKTSEQQIQKWRQQSETNSTITGPSNPASTPLAEPERQRQLKDPQLPSKLRGYDSRVSLHKRQEPLGRTTRTHSTGRRKPKNLKHTNQSPSCTTRHQPRTPHQCLHHPPRTATTIPRSPAQRSETNSNTIYHFLYITGKVWREIMQDFASFFRFQMT